MIAMTPNVGGHPIRPCHGIVTGVDPEYEVNNNMLLVSASGTAVSLG